MCVYYMYICARRTCSLISLRFCYGYLKHVVYMFLLSSLVGAVVFFRFTPSVARLLSLYSRVYVCFVILMLGFFGRLRSNSHVRFFSHFCFTRVCLCMCPRRVRGCSLSRVCVCGRLCTCVFALVIYFFLVVCAARRLFRFSLRTCLCFLWSPRAACFYIMSNLSSFSASWL